MMSLMLAFSQPHHLCQLRAGHSDEACAALPENKGAIKGRPYKNVTLRSFVFLGQGPPQTQQRAEGIFQQEARKSKTHTKTCVA